MPDQEADEFVVSDPELITRVRTGDREAFGELYKRHSGAATTLSRQFARSATESDDLVSESFARVLDNLLAGKGPDTAFRAYLFTTIRNTAYDRTRKDKRLQFTDDMSTHDVAVVGVDPVLAKMESGLIATAFAQLPERWQAVLWHTQVEGESPAQVGALLGMAPGAVSSLAFRAREGLREAYLQAHLAETAAEQCRTTVDRLGAWTRGGLSKREKAQVDAHLETCDRCRALAAELEEVNHGLRGLLAPLLLGGAAAGYLATLGPVAPLAAPGTLIAGAGSSGAGGTGGSGGAAGSGGGAGAAGAGAGGTAGSVAATAAGVAAAAAAAGAIGLTAWAAAGSAGGATAAAAGTAAAGAAGTGAAGAGAAVAGAGTAGAGAAAAGGGAAGAGGAAAAGTGGAAAGGAGGAGSGAAGAGSAGAGATAGAGGVFAGLGVGGLVAAGAALVLAAVAAVVFIVNGNSPDTINTAGQDAAGSGQSPNSSADPAGGIPGAGGTSNADPGAGAGAGTAGTAASVPAVPGGNPGTTGAIVPVVDPSTQATEPAANQTDGQATQPVVTTTAGQPNSSGGPTTQPVPTDPAATDPQNTETVTAPATPDPTTTGQPTEPATTQPETSTTETSTTDPTTTPPPPAADLTVTDLTAQTLNAGGSADVSFAITNNGDGASAVESLSVDLPVGVEVTNVTYGTVQPALRRVNAGLLRAGPCVTQTPTNCTLNLPAVAPLTTLPVILTLSAETTAEGGQVTVTVLGKSVTFQLIVNSPAALTLGPLSVSDPLTAGGTGRLSLDVTNIGKQASVEQAVQIDGLPGGVSVTGITATGINEDGTQLCTADGPANAALAAVSATCTLPSVAPATTVTLLIDLDVQPFAQTPTEAATTVTIGDNLTSAPLSLTVNAGITELRTEPSGPFTAGQPAVLTVTPELQGTATTAGSVTLTSTDERITFGPSTGCTPAPESDAVTCTTSPFDLDIVIPVDHPAGLLALRATDAGGRELPDVTLQIAAAAPANLEVDGLAVSAPLIAGGGGQLTLTVSNTGALPSAEQAIEVVLPKGITVDGITAGQSQLCTAGEPAVSCVLPPLDAGTSRTLVIGLAVPATTIDKPGDASVTIGNGPKNGASTTLTVTSGITALSADTTEPLLTNSTQVLQITAASTVQTPGPVTFLSTSPGVTFNDTEGCKATAGSSTVVCEGASFSLSIAVSAEQKPGILPVTVIDAGLRKLSLTDANGNDLQIELAAPQLQLGKLSISTQLLAGGTGELGVQLSNIGGQRSAPQPIEIDLPTGVALSDMTVGDSSICAPVGEGTPTCTVPGIDPTESITIVIQLTVQPDTDSAPGLATVIVKDDPRPGLQTEPIELAVESGISVLRAQQPGPFTAGTTAQLTLTPELVKGVTEAGKVTLTAEAPVTFGESKTCTPNAGGSEITCDGNTFTVSVRIPADQKAGPLPVTAVDGGGRAIDLLNSANNPLQVLAAPAHLLIDGVKVSQGVEFAGSITLTVRNPGTEASDPMLIDVSMPTGFSSVLILRQARLAFDIRSCTTTTCPLGPIDAGGSVDLTIYFIASSSAVSGPGTITVDGQVGKFTVTGRGRLNLDLLGVGDSSAPDQATARPDPAAPSDFGRALGIPETTSATALPDPQAQSTEPPTPAPSADPVTTTETPQPTPAESGTDESAPTTDTSTVPTTRSAESAAPASPGPASTDTVTTEATPETSAAEAPAPSQAPETSPADGPPPTDSTPGSDEPTSEPVPAAVTLTEPGSDTALIAGGNGTLTFTAVNSGGERSTPVALDVSLPGGVSVTSVSVNGTTICGSESCRLPGINPGESVNVVVAIAAAAGAEPGGAQATISGGGVGWMLDVEPGDAPEPPSTEPSGTQPARIPNAAIPDVLSPDFGDRSPTTH